MRFAGVLLVCAAFAAAASADPIPVWRMHTEHLAADRAAVHACLENGRHDCEQIIQEECLGTDGQSSGADALSRQCDWRAIAAWEDEMNASLSFLRARMQGADLARLNASQRAWNSSMLGDVGVGMDYYEGGSIAGPIGAHIRAKATADRVIYLEYLKSIVGDE